MRSFILAGALALTSGVAQAQTITVDFPSEGAEWLSQGNSDSGILADGGATNYMFRQGDYVRQSFANTGLASATGITGMFTYENVLGGTDLLIDVLVNSVAVGQITIASCDFCFEVQSASYDFDFGTIAGGDYQLQLQWANSIPGSDGSVRVFDGGMAMLTGAAVPEPATWALMIFGFGAIGGAMRVRRREIAFG